MIAESVFKTRNVVCQHVKRKTSSLIPFYSSFSTGVIALWLKSNDVDHGFNSSSPLAILNDNFAKMFGIQV